jgi:hypothetical protein
MARRPEGGELTQVVRSRQQLPRDGAVNDNVVTGNVFENAIVRRRRAPAVMLGRQTVDRH